MFRYVAFGWNAASTTQAQAASAMAARLQVRNCWRSVYRASGLWVFCAGVRAGSSEVYVLPDGRGVILGKLFSSAGETRGSGETLQSATGRIHETQGRSLVTEFWGRYVAFLHDTARAVSRVVRDPTGALPCFVTLQDEVHVFVSDIQDFARVQPRHWTINWQYIARRMTNALLVREEPETALVSVSRLLPGECIELTVAGVERQRYWNAKDIIARGPIETPAAACAALREGLRRSIHAWASCYPRVLHLLSGGFDSSLVLSCLRSAPGNTAVTCINYFDSANASDEREYARLIAARYDTPLVEIEQHPSAVKLERMLDVRRFAVPWSFLYFVEHSDQQGQLAASTGAGAIFSGTAGDQIFFQGPLPLAATDCLRRFGPGRLFFDYCLSLARVQGSSVWAVIAGAIRQWHCTRPWALADEAGYNSVVSRDVIQSVNADTALRRRWTDLARGLPPGKLYHVHAMSCGHEFYDPLGGEDYPERVRPLVSQPLIETCLRIPTYVLAADGFDRAAARRAFREELPEKILRRQMKGAIDTYLARIASANLPFIRDIMLDGLLVRNGLLDRGRLEWALSRSTSTARLEACDVVASYLSTEVWARGWAAA